MELQQIQSKIYEVRSQKVMLDFDLAELYEVETRVLNQAIKRNMDSFPEDFMFKLSAEEWDRMSSQFVMTYPAKRPKSALPYAFTEHGVTMLASVLKSKTARQMNIAIVRAFVFMKQYALSHADLTRKLEELESRYDQQFDNVYEAINFLLDKDKKQTEQNERNRIGYKK